MPTKEPPPGYRCPGCTKLHQRAPRFPGCGTPTHTTQDDETKEDERRGRQ